jgi:hypothetical protein
MVCSIGGRAFAGEGSFSEIVHRIGDRALAGEGSLFQNVQMGLLAVQAEIRGACLIVLLRAFLFRISIVGEGSLFEIVQMGLLMVHAEVWGTCLIVLLRALLFWAGIAGSLLPQIILENLLVARFGFSRLKKFGERAI